MTDAERLPDADSDRTEDETPSTEPVEPGASGAGAEHSRAATFRSDGGPGSVLRERQPGFGGLDAREAAAGEPAWQDVTSDRYGHRIELEEVEVTSSEEGEGDAPSGESPGRE